MITQEINSGVLTFQTILTKGKQIQILSQKPEDDADASVIATASSASGKLQLSFSSGCKGTFLASKQKHFNLSRTKLMHLSFLGRQSNIIIKKI